MAWSISNAMMKDYENWLCSQAPEAESSAVTCSDGEQSAQSNTTPMPDQYYWPDKTTEHSRLSRFGMTCKPLTASHGEAVLTWFLAGFPARTLVQQEREPDLRASAAACGVNLQGSLARYDQSSSTWRTAQCSLVEGLDEYLETWPNWGSMRNGALYLRPIPALPILENASGLWQTPVADDAIERKDGKWNSRGEPKLSAEVKIWPTPNALPASNDLKLNCSGDGRVKPNKLGWAVSESGVDGLLNPAWVEWLMGWPAGWTDLKPLATAKFQEWLQQHGNF